MVETLPEMQPAGRRARFPRGMPAWASRFTAAAILGAAGTFALSAGALGSPLPQAGVVTALFICACLVVAARMRDTYPHKAIGFCNIVTLLRLALTVTLLAPLLAPGSTPDWAVFVLAVMALGLDGVDGWFARRQGLNSRFGARFDMEVDAALSLILALNALAAGSAGPLVLLLGIPRYAFAVAGLVLPWLSSPLPDRFWRKVACVLQIGVLIALQAPILPSGFTGSAIMAAISALVWSFGRDVVWLYRRHT